MRSLRIITIPECSHAADRIPCEYIETEDGQRYNLVLLSTDLGNDAPWVAFRDRSPWEPQAMGPDGPFKKLGWGDCHLNAVGPEEEKSIVVLWYVEELDRIEAETGVSVLGEHQKDYGHFRTAAILAILAPGQTLVAYPPEDGSYAGIGKTLVRNEEGEAVVYRQMWTGKR